MDEFAKDIEYSQEELETDVIVVGAGQAGTCAARGASEIERVDVVVIEQQSKDKQFILGNGEIGHINSKWLKKQRFPKIDIDEFVNDWQLRTNNRSNYKLIRIFAEKCGDCFDWFIEPLSKEQKASIYPLLKNPSNHLPEMLNYIHAYPGTAKMPVSVQNEALKLNQEEAIKNGAKFMFETRACQLIVEEGKVTGLIVKHDNRYIRILARKGVILAAGDYSKNEQMCRDLLTEAADLIEQGTDWLGHGWDGSGIQIGDGQVEELSLDLMQLWEVIIHCQDLKLLDQQQCFVLTNMESDIQMKDLVPIYLGFSRGKAAKWNALWNF